MCVRLSHILFFYSLLQGGMENWGLITYKEQYLIVDENSHHREVIESIRVTSHELAHQFFGNLVTCEWWSYIWIQEGLATVFEYHTPDAVLPEYRMKHLFNLQLQNGLRVDSSASVRAMTSAVERNEDLPGVFDRIAYDKSGSVLRMFQHVLGEDIFKSGLNRLIEDNNHTAIRPEHVYEAFQDVMDANAFTAFKFADAFKTWELQSGSPVIHVKHDRDLKQFHITQKRYLKADSNEIDSSSWHIPLNFAHAGNSDFEDTKVSDYFEDGTLEKIISTENIAGFDDDGWFVFNKQQLGFYRVNYDLVNWRNIIKVLNSESYREIHVLNRAQLVDDAINFAIDGHIDFDVALNVLTYLERETDYLPWAAVATYLDRLSYWTLGHEVHEMLQKFFNKLVSRLYATHGLEQKAGEDYLNNHARELAINWACKTVSAQCLHDTYEKIKLAMTDGKSIPKPLEITFLCNGLRGIGRTNEFVYFYEKMRESTDQAERLRLIDGLACASDPESIKSFLETSVAYNSDVNYRLHERPRIFNSVLSSSSIGITATLDFISQNADDIKFMYQQSPDDLLIAVARRIVTIEHEAKLMQVLSLRSDSLKPETSAAVLQSINSNKDFQESPKTALLINYVTEYVRKLEEDEHYWRLPRNSEPTSYDLHLVSNVHTGSLAVNGEVEIKLKVLLQTNRLTLHSRDLNIQNLNLFDASGDNEITIERYSLYAPTETLTVYLMQDLNPNTEFTLKIKYSFTMNEPPTFLGLYRTSYVDSNGARKYIAATHSVHANARTFVPSYDEPSFPAVFRISITHDASYKATANTEGSRRPNGDSTVTTIFEETPLMATYLIGFVVSDFESITNELTKGPDETLHRISTRPNAHGNAWHALQICEKLLKDLEEYLDFKYDLPKIDYVAVTGTDGPIVVWGLVTYPEEFLLFEENFEDSSHVLRLEGVRTLAHELIHQFFGNAVLIDFWSHLWLIEGFTTIFESQLMGNLYPEWQERDFFNIQRLQSVFQEDELKSAPAVTEIVVTLDEIWSNFGSIAYDKAGCVLRMFQNAVGPENFRQAIGNYVKTNHHKTVMPADLLLEFENVLLAKDFKDFQFTKAFQSWELQKGYPVLTVKHYKDIKEIHARQKRFFIDASLVDDAASSWTIPINIATSTNPNFDDTTFTHYFEQGEIEIEMPIDDEPEWFVINKQQIGYYRVNYDAENWQNLINVLQSENYQQIHVLNRAQLVDDALSLAEADLLDYDIAVGVLSYLRQETAYAPWAATLKHLNRISELFGGRNVNYNKFMRLLSANFYAAFPTIENKIPNEPIVERYAREISIHYACQAGNEVATYASFVQVHLFEDHDEPVPKGLEEVLYTTGMRGTNRSDVFVGMWTKMQASNEIEERSLIIKALGLSKIEEALESYLDASLATNSDVNFRTGERLQIFNSVASSEIGIKALIEFLKRNSQIEITRMYSTSITVLLTTIAINIKDQSDATLFANYLTSHSNLPSELIAALTRQTNENLDKQKEEKVEKLLEAMRKIAFEWEPEEVTTVVQETTVQETTADTTLGASSLSVHISLLITFLLIASLLK